MIVLSILICSIHERAGMLSLLMQELNRQIEQNNANDLVEIIVETDCRGESTTGAKRNELYKLAAGTYSTSIDDDDRVAPNYLSEILKAAKEDTDSIAISGWIETNGKDRVHWDISKDNGYEAVKDNGVTVYKRYPNHITPIKSEICKRFLFEDISHFEDFKWATLIHNSGLIKTEAKTQGELYYYRYNNTK